MFIFYTLQLPVQDRKNCLFDSVLFFFPHKPSTYRGSNLGLQLISTMAQYPDQYKVLLLNL